MKEVVNLTTRALPLSDGTMLAAKGTPGSVKQVESVNEKDARRLSGMIFIRDVEVAPVAPASKKVPDKVVAEAKSDK